MLDPHVAEKHISVRQNDGLDKQVPNEIVPGRSRVLELDVMLQRGL
jgi:hypothetical protein